MGALLGASAIARPQAAAAVVGAPAAGRIAYQGRLVIGTRGIIVMSGSGENPVELPHPAESDRITPALSPDGTMLAYAAKDGAAYKLWIVRLAADNSPVGDPMQVTTSDADDEQPAWSPDGQRLAYVSGTADKRALFTIPIKGGEPTELVSLGADFRNACPHWSPDSTRIVFSSGGKLFIISADGRETRQLTDDGMYPSWSPDGSRIAFFRLKPEPALCVIAPEGGEPRMMVKNVEYFGETAWSPDGKSIAFKADKVGAAEGSLWLAPAAGGPAKELRSYGVAHGYLDWSAGPVRLAAARAARAGGAKPAAVTPITAMPETAATTLAAAGAKPGAQLLRLKMQTAARPTTDQASGQPKPALAKAVKVAAPTSPKAQAVAAKPTKPTTAMASAGGAPTPRAPAAVESQTRLPAPATANASTVAPTSAPTPPAAAKPPDARSQLPPVRIVSPADGATVRGVTRVMVSKDTQDGYVSFFVDGRFEEATIAPFELQWDTGKLSDGPHAISVTGYAGTGAVQGQTQVRIEVQNAVATESLPPEGITLRYRYKDKEKWDYQLQVAARPGTPGEIPSPAVAAEVGSLDALITQRVESVKEAPVATAGAAKTAGTTSATKETTAAAKTQTVATLITQVRSGKLDAPGAQGVLPTVGRAARSTRTPEGVVTPLETPGRASQPIALGNLSIVFPDHAVKIGDKWTAPMTVLPVLQSGAIARVNAEHSVDSVEWQQGLETVRIVSTFKAASLPVGVEGMSLDGVTGTRVTWFAYKEHRIVRLEDNLQGTFNQKALEVTAAAAVGAAAAPAAGWYRSAATAPASPTQTAPRRAGMSLGFGRREGMQSGQPRQPTAPIQPGTVRLTFGGRAGIGAAARTPGIQPTQRVQPTQGTQPTQRIQPGSPPSPVFHYTLTLVAALQK
jgi:TolB protein